MIVFKQYASSSGGNMYTAESCGDTIMIEAGIPIADIKKHLNFNLHAISGCLVTHEHGDHAKACKDMLKAGVELYTSQGTADKLGLSGLHLHTVRSRHQFKIGRFLIMPFPVEHDAAEPLGFLISDGEEKLLFITDTQYIQFKFNGLSIIAVECNHSLDLIAGLEPFRRKRLMETHMSLETCIDLLKANDLAKVREIHLLHLSSGNSDAPLFKRTIEDLTGKPVYII